jgi:hypothetical protein
MVVRKWNWFDGAGGANLRQSKLDGAASPVFPQGTRWERLPRSGRLRFP